MADLARIKRNVAKMASMNAPEADIDGYIASEGVTVDDVRNYGKDYTLGRIGTIDRGITFGLGRKLGGIINAIGSYPVDRVAEAMGVQNTPDFMDRYHEVVDPTMQAIEQYHEDKPVEAFALEMGAGFANPVNKIGVNYIKDAKNLAGTAVRSGIVGTGVGGVAGALNTENIDNLAVNTLGGAGAGGIIGTAMPVAANRAGALYNGLKRIVAPEASVARKATGLGNIVKDNESVRALNRGIMADDAVAAQVLQEAPTQMGRLNEELSDILNKTTGRKLNIEGAKQNADEAYRSYVAQNADYPVYTTEEVKIPTVKRYKDGDYIAVAKSIRRNMSKEDPNFKWRKDKNGNYDYEHFISDPQRTEYLQTFKSTYKNPQHVVNAPNKENLDRIYLLSQYLNPQRNTNVYDKITINPENGVTISKLAREGRVGRQEFAKEFRKGQTSQASESALGLSQTGSAPSSTLRVNNNITQNGANVKRNVPNIKDIVGKLNTFKQNAMNKALAEGAAMSDYPVGSLDAVHKAQGVLNDMIEASYDKSVLGVKRPTTETTQLIDLKQVFNNMLEPSGVKPLDVRISKAKSLDYFRDMGYKFKPSEKKFEDLGIKTLRDKRAFLQGRLQAILDNVKDDKNLAKAIRADENTLKKLMPAKKFNELLNETSRIDREYTRLNKFAQLASRELDKPIAADRPMSERGETWSSYLSSLYDKANARLWQNSNRRRAQALLNGGAVNPEWVQTLENYGAQYSPRYLTPYLAQIIAQNQ